MSTPVVPIEALAPEALLAATSAPVQAPPASQFGQWFTRELDAVNTQMVRAERSVQELAAGGTANVHDAMLQIEQARLSFQFAIQVRSRVLEAYQEVMRMQV